jgi:hypothetical protein
MALRLHHQIDEWMLAMNLDRNKRLTFSHETILKATLVLSHWLITLVCTFFIQVALQS